MIGIKWQMDVKFVPKICYVGKDGRKFYQYTMIEEASRKRFIYAYEENSSYSTIDFVKRAIIFFGYAPKTIQTDNGMEFTHFAKTKRVHPFDVFCNRYKIEHKLIRPRTPWHNGKVERSHRNDQERFYNHLSFYSFADLQEQMKRYLRRSNSIPMAVLGWKSPNQKQLELENTCAAFVAAGNRDYWGIETDVHQTADGKYIIFHDDNTGRVTTTDMVVEMSTFDQLRALQLHEVRNNNAIRADLKMPSPEEYFAICKRYGKVAVFELKNPFEEARIEELVAIAKKEIGIENVVFSAFGKGDSIPCIWTT